jgi:hypothetical protein
VVVKAPFTSTRSFCDRLLCVPENVRVVSVLSANAADTLITSGSSSLSAAPFTIIALIVLAPTSPASAVGSSDRCFLLFAEDRYLSSERERESFQKPLAV